MTVIVTGSSGLLGRHVAAAMVEARHRILGLDAVAPTFVAAWDHRVVDLADLGAALQVVRDAEAVVHCAAIPRPIGMSPGHVFKTNIATAYNVVEAAVLNGATRLVYASSISVLGFPFFETPVTPCYLPFDAAHPAAPQDAYGLSKWLGEEIVDAAVRRRSTLSAVSLRMPWLQTAESFPRDVAPRRAHDALVARDLWAYLDVHDAAAAFVAAVERPVDGHKRLFLSAVDTFMEAETAALVRAAYPGVALKRPLLGRETVFDLGMARELLGFAPRLTWRGY